MNLSFSEYDKGEGGDTVSERNSRRPFTASGRIAVVLLWTAFVAGCVLGSLYAAGITEAALERLRESLTVYANAAVNGSLRQSFGECLLDLLPWTLASVVLAVFVSSGVTLPLLLGLRGGILGFLAAAMLMLYGWPAGLYWFGAVCGTKNVLLLFSMAAVITPNFTRTLQRLRNRGSNRIYALDRPYLRSAAVSLAVMFVGAAADLYLTPVLTAWLAR